MPLVPRPSLPEMQIPWMDQVMTRKGGKQSPEEIAKRVAARRANGTYKHSPATRAKISAIQKGRKRKPLPPEQRAKIAASLKGRPLSSERKAAISAGTRAAMWRPDVRAKLPVGERAHNWKGNECGYDVAHDRAKRRLGPRPVGTCPSCGRTSGRIEISFIPELCEPDNLRWDEERGWAYDPTGEAYLYECHGCNYHRGQPRKEVA